MGNSNPLNLDVRGLVEAQARLALIAMPPRLRKRLLNRVAMRLRTPGVNASVTRKTCLAAVLNPEGPSARKKCCPGWPRPWACRA